MPGVNTDDDEYPVNDTRKIKAKLLNEIVAARVEEIVANVQRQIALSGYENKLPAGIIVTGGGSNLRNLQDAFKQQKSDYVKVRIANFVIPDVKYIDSTVLEQDGRRNTIFALLAMGKENCASQEKETSTLDMFEQQQEEEARRREAEERERLEKEAAAKAKAQEEAKRAKEAKEKAELENQINNNAKKDIDAAAANVANALKRIEDAKKKVKEAETNKSGKEAQQASQDGRQCLEGRTGC